MAARYPSSKHKFALQILPLNFLPKSRFRFDRILIFLVQNLQKLFKIWRKKRSGGCKFILAHAVFLKLVRKTNPPNSSAIYPYFRALKRCNLLKFILCNKLLPSKNIDVILIKPKAFTRDEKPLQPK